MRAILIIKAKLTKERDLYEQLISQIIAVTSGHRDRNATTWNIRSHNNNYVKKQIELSRLAIIANEREGERKEKNARKTEIGLVSRILKERTRATFRSITITE